MEHSEIGDFCKAIESLRQYRRYELLDAHNKDLLDKIYVDPLDGDGLLNLCLQDNTTVLVGRKGTGKSTIFMRMQNELRKSSDIMTCYLDVKTIYDTARQNYTTINYLAVKSPQMVEEYSLQREFVLEFVKELITEIDENYNNFIASIKKGLRRSRAKDAINKLKNIKTRISDNESLKDIEMQTLQECSLNIKDSSGYCTDDKVSADMQVGKVGIGAEGRISVNANSEFGRNYNRVFARIFSISDLIAEIEQVLQDLSMKRLFVILDDYSEVDQSALSSFCSLIVNSLNNNSDNFIKLKISAYPGRVELGELDRQKIDIRYIDYYNLYASKRDEMEANAIDYTRRIIEKRLQIFTGKDFGYYFDLSKNSEDDYCRLIFQMSLNVIRHIGLVLDYAKDTSILQGKKIGIADLHDAAKKFYSERLSLYFEESRSAQMAYDERAELFQLERLLSVIVNKEKTIRTKIRLKEYTATIFDSDRANPYTSHFYISQELESRLSSLELNFFISKYNEMVSKNKEKISVYCLNYGLCEKENLHWGKPEGNEYRTYFIESPFNFTPTIGTFFSDSKRIVCTNCGFKYIEKDLPMLERYGMNCIECNGKNTVKIISLLPDKDRKEIERIQQKSSLLDREQFTFVKLAIIKGGNVTASEMAQEMDVSNQKIGWIAKKLQEKYHYLIKAKRGYRIMYTITDSAKNNYS